MAATLDRVNPRLHGDLWLLVLEPDESINERFARANKLWQKWHSEAVAGAARLSRVLLQQVAASGARDQFILGPPASEIRELLGDESGDLAFAAWSLIAGPLLSELDGLCDPFHPDEVAKIATRQGAAVLLCAWWGMRAVYALSQHDRDAFTERIATARNEWNALSA